VRRRLEQLMRAVFRTVWGTDAECQMGIVRVDDSHITQRLAEHADKKIDEMNAATERLARLQPAANLEEAMRQLTGE
jgi:hypothetical protein